MALRRLLMALAMLVLVTGEAFAHSTLIVQARVAGYVPGTDFDRIRTTVTFEDGRVAERTHVVDPSRPYSMGIRVAEVGDIPEGTHRAQIALMLGGAVVHMRPAVFEMGGHFHWAWGDHANDGTVAVRVLTILFAPPGEDPGPPPIVRPIKTVTLERDNDGSGTVTTGDEIRYSVEFDAAHVLLRGSFFHDQPSQSTPLIPGSVTASHGVVFRGNFPSDTDILVNFAPIAEGEIVRISYLARVEPVAVNQGEVVVRAQGNEYLALTDDPETQLEPDATAIVLGCSDPQGGGELDRCLEDLGLCKAGRDECLGRLGVCEEKLSTCGAHLAESTAENADLRDQLAALQVELAGLVGDPDGDGVPTMRDDCPATAAGDAVDAQGCSLSQYCASRPATTPRERLVCWVSDWRQDDLLRRPRDCRPLRREGRCVAR